MYLGQTENILYSASYYMSNVFTSQWNKGLIFGIIKNDILVDIFKGWPEQRARTDSYTCVPYTNISFKNVGSFENLRDIGTRFVGLRHSYQLPHPPSSHSCRENPELCSNINFVKLFEIDPIYIWNILFIAS